MEVSSDEAMRDLILKTNAETQVKTFVHSEVTKYLKTHQIDGIKFLFENCYEENSGCILAHCMGLGKTLQVISLLHAVINSNEYPTNKVLVLCPISTIINWKEEIFRWLNPISGHRKLHIFELDQKDDIHRKISCLEKWSHCDSKSPASCLIMGYDAFRNLVNFHLSKANSKKYSDSSLRQIREHITNYLLKPADIVICDEGHFIKNINAAITLAVNQIQTKKRIILTGTPMQNHLMEYYSMVNFVRPNFLSTKQHFNEYFAEPIKNGQHADSCETDIKYMKQRSYALNKKLAKIVQRREISLLKDFLPEKLEFVLFVPLTDIQYKLYKHFLDHRGGSIEYKRLFGDYTCLRKIWTHLKVLDNAHQKSVAKKKRTNPKNDDNTSNDDDDDEEEFVSSGGLQLVDNDWWRKVINKNQLQNASSSHKMVLLFEILKECQRVGDKCVIFSSFVEVLNVVEFFMQQIDKRQNNDNGLETFVGPWKKNEDYYRLDGSTPKDRRHSLITKFNDVNNTRTKVFLISAQAGGQGVNLFGANRLILLDTSWNPSKDQQSIFRIYRMGQTKPCYIYRLLSMGTMEEKIYSRSVTKQAMSCRVVDKQQIDRHYRMDELYELYSLAKTDMQQRPVPILPKDNLLAHLLQKYPDMIYKYLEHDTLLANKAEEDLNEVEKKEAWQRCQEQNLQLQALNSMAVEQQTVTSSSFTSHNSTSRVSVKSQEKEVTTSTLVSNESLVNTNLKTNDSLKYKESSSFDKQLADSFGNNEVNQECSEDKEHTLQKMDVLPSLVRCISGQRLTESSTNVESSNEDDQGSLENVDKENQYNTEVPFLVRCTSDQIINVSSTASTESLNDDDQGLLLPLGNVDTENKNISDQLLTESSGKSAESSNDDVQGLLLPLELGNVDKENECNIAVPSVVRCTSGQCLAESSTTSTEHPNDDVQELLLPLDQGRRLAQSSTTSSESLNDEDQGLLHPLDNVDKENQYNTEAPSLVRSTSDQSINGSSTSIKSSDDDDEGLLLPQKENEDADNKYIEKRDETSVSAFAKGLLHKLNTKCAVAEQQQNEPDTIDDYTREEQIIPSNQFFNLEYRIAFKRPSNSDIQRPIKRLKLSLEIDPTAAITVDQILSSLPHIINDTTASQDFVFTEHLQSPNTNDDNLLTKDISFESHVVNLNRTVHSIPMDDLSSIYSSEDAVLDRSSTYSSDSKQVIEPMYTVTTETEYEQITSSSSVPLNDVITKNSTEYKESFPKSVQESMEFVTGFPPHEQLLPSSSMDVEDEEMSLNDVKRSTEYIVMSGMSHYVEQQSPAAESTTDEELSLNILQHPDGNVDDEKNVPTDYDGNDTQSESEPDSLADIWGSMETSSTDEQDLYGERHHETSFVQEDRLLEESNSSKSQSSALSRIKGACILM